MGKSNVFSNVNSSVKKVFTTQTLIKCPLNPLKLFSGIRYSGIDLIDFFYDRPSSYRVYDDSTYFF